MMTHIGVLLFGLSVGAAFGALKERARWLPANFPKRFVRDRGRVYCVKEAEVAKLQEQLADAELRYRKMSEEHASVSSRLATSKQTSETNR